MSTKKYDTLDTIVIPTAGRTDSVRVSATVNGNGDPATSWTFTNGRLTLFGSDAERCRTANKLVADLMEDGTALEEMNLFTDKYNN